ncbi:MAG TPA: pyroglutamyl-peptidase I [Blastocatellia bacterium]
MKRLMLTAFEPFAGEKINPSLEAARQMAGVEFRGAAINVLELPVERYRAIEITLDRLREMRPAIVIMLGVAIARFRIMPERVAINVDDFRIPDNAGDQPAGEPIVEGGPVGYFSTLPIRAIVDCLLQANIPSAISSSAGTYLCNRLFYSVMHHIATERLPTAAGFIHVPYQHEMALGKYPDVPSMARDTIVEGVRLAIEVSIEQAGRTTAT